MAGWCLHLGPGRLLYLNDCRSAARSLSAPLIYNRSCPTTAADRENGGDKKRKVEDGYCGGEDSTTNEHFRQEAEDPACSHVHRYRAVDTVVRTCRLSDHLQE